nr:TPA_asm: truncated PolB [Mytilus Mediterranean mussel adintovirus]
MYTFRIFKIREHFNYRSYSKSKINYILSGAPIKEFVGLRPKMYSLKYDTTEKCEDGRINKYQVEKKVAKGIARCEIKNTLRHENYKKCLFNETVTLNSMNLIRSKNHQLFIDTIVKKGLCSFDDKRYWKNPIESYAFGHYKIGEM